ncbi:hypothetical protein HMPREF1326_00711 [Akkermansia sp. KLE1605]|nr:hypothetical protein HMPREF1326_00711 [Akkermansia sp. KLE1605]
MLIGVNRGKTGNTKQWKSLLQGLEASMESWREVFGTIAELPE